MILLKKISPFIEKKLSGEYHSFKIVKIVSYGNKLEFSNFFEKDSKSSFEFTIVKILFERATLREASSFKSFLDKTIAEDNKSIIVDLNICEFVDSSFCAGHALAGHLRTGHPDQTSAPAPPRQRPESPHIRRQNQACGSPGHPAYGPQPRPVSPIRGGSRPARPAAAG